MTGRLEVGGVDVSSLFSSVGFAGDDGVSSAGTHDGGGGLDFTLTSWQESFLVSYLELDRGVLDAVFGVPRQSSSAFRMDWSEPEPEPEPAPVRPAGRAAVGYRRARRRYGRAVRRWRRAGSPERQHALYVPHAHIEMETRL